MKNKDTIPMKESLLVKIKKSITAQLLINPSTKDELLAIIEQAKQDTLIDNDASHMIEGVLAVSERQASDVMIPRAQMVVVAGESNPEDALPTVTQSGHSRFPITNPKQDKIIGILLAKDLLKTLTTDNKKNIQLQKLARPAMFVPESTPLDNLLNEFRQQRNHMAIVVNEYGDVSGLITMEDIFEEIVGDIADEYDTKTQIPPIQSLNNGSHLVKARTPIEEFNDYFNTHFVHEDFDTIGGLLLKNFSYMPHQNESIIIEKFEFTIVKANNRAIEQILVKPIDSDTNS
jgi:magnesium and cobalt transporter